MGDLCYMTVTCRRQDQKRFEALGFHVEYVEDNETQTGETIALVDEEANYGHCGNLPTDIPWTGEHAEGGDYGPAVLACDGKEICEAEAGHGGGFVVALRRVLVKPPDEFAIVRPIEVERSSLRAIEEYLACLERAEKLLNEPVSVPSVV